MKKLLTTRPVRLALPPDPEPADAVFHRARPVEYLSPQHHRSLAILFHGASSARAATASTPGATHRPQRILVVDDDPALRQLGTKVLIRHGYQVDAAEDSTTGWKALQIHTYDLLITDLDMPGLSGLRLVKRLRAARLAVPVILASGTMTPQELNRTPWLHLSGALLKPVSPDQLLQTVQAVLCAPGRDSRRNKLQEVPPGRLMNSSSAFTRLRQTQSQQDGAARQPGAPA